MKNLKVAFLLVFISQIGIASEINVRDLGAKGDGKTLDTKAIQAAVDKCAQTGGKVMLSKGTFLTGTIYLKSNVTLVVEKGAVMLGSLNLEDYPVNEFGFNNLNAFRVNRALIYASGMTNIGIEGGGIIDGQGGSFVKALKLVRPFLLWFKECKGVNVEKVELRNSAMWMQYYVHCEDVRISDIKVFNHGNSNNDMLDIDGCRNVIIDGVIGDSDDDGITFKSMDTCISENIIVSNCIMGSHCNGLKFGTETTGGFRNVTITNCVIRSSVVDSVDSGTREGTSGISLEIVDGGIMENINISNIVIDGPRVSLFVRLGNRARKYYSEAPPPPIGQIKNIQISNIIARSSRSIMGLAILGIPGGMIENITLSNIKLTLTGGGTEEDARFLVPENADRYPDASEFGGFGRFSACGLYARHVKGLVLSGLNFELLDNDARPLMYFDDVHNSKIQAITVSGKQVTDKCRIEKNCTNLTVQDEE
jgi:polygalacturonase